MTELFRAVSVFEMLLRGVPTLPQRPGKEKCKNFLRYNNCQFPNCRFDHPKPIRVEAKIEMEIARDLPELALLIDISNRIRECFDKCSPRELGDSTHIQAAATRSIEQFLEFVNDILPLRLEVTRSSMAREEVIFGYMIYFYFDLLPKLFKSIKSLQTIRRDHEYKKILDKFFASENSNASRIRSLIDNPTCQVETFLEEMDDQIVQFTAEQTHLMITKGNVYEMVRGELLSALVGEFRYCGFNVNLDAFGSVASSLGSPKSDLDLSITVAPISSSSSPMPTPMPMPTPNTAIKTRSLLSNGKVLEAVLECLNLEAPPDEDDDEFIDLDQQDDEDNDEDNFNAGGGAAGMGAGVGGGASASPRKSSRGQSLALSAFTVREFVSSARVPVLKLHHPATGTDIDVIHNNENGLQNTRLLRQYAYHDPRVRPLILAVKRWSSNRGTNNSQNCTLSSYAWVLLVVFFCQSRPLPVLSNLQAPGPGSFKPQMEGGSGGSLVPPEPNESSIRGISKLLLEMFLFYGAFAEGCFHFQDYVAAVRFGRKLVKPHLHRERLSTPGAEGGKNRRSRRTGKRERILAAKAAAAGGDAATEDGVVAELEDDDDDDDIDDDEDDEDDEDDDGGDSKQDEKDISLQLSALSLSPPESPALVALSPPPAPTPPIQSPTAQPAKSDSFSIQGSSVARNALQWRLSVEDPIEIAHDLGGVIHNPLGQLHITSELRRALLLMDRALTKSTLLNAAEQKQEQKQEQELKQGAKCFEELCMPCHHIPQVPFNRTCRMCREEGHSPKQCPLFICMRCGKQGHIARTCNEPRRPGGGGGGGGWGGRGGGRGRGGGGGKGGGGRGGGAGEGGVGGRGRGRRGNTR